MSKNVEVLRSKFPEYFDFDMINFFINCPYSFDELLQVNRKRDLMQWRQIGMAWKALCGYSLTESGATFRKDHATCIHAIRCMIDAFDGYAPDMLYKIKTIEMGINVNIKHEDDSMNEVVSLILQEKRIKELI